MSEDGPVLLVVDDNEDKPLHADTAAETAGLRQRGDGRARTARAGPSGRTPLRSGPARHHDAGDGRLRGAGDDEGRFEAARRSGRHDLRPGRDRQRRALHRAWRGRLSGQALQPDPCCTPASAPVWRRNGSGTRKPLTWKGWESERKRSDELLRAILPAERGAGDEGDEWGSAQAVRGRRRPVTATSWISTNTATGTRRNRRSRSLRPWSAASRKSRSSTSWRRSRRAAPPFSPPRGLLHQVPDPVLRATRCGLEIAAAARTEPGWQVRTGLHVGPVVAGVGVQSPALLRRVGRYGEYRSPSSSEHADPGHVAMIDATWLQIRDRCRGRTRGPVAIEGKDEVELVECLEAP